MMNEIIIKDELNEINIDDEIKNALVRFGEELVEAFEPLLDAFGELEPYQRYELLHPRKKPRGSIRRARKRGKR